MKKFLPADPQQARIKIGIYGPQGSGKTLTALMWAERLCAIDGKKIAYIDTERGTDFYAMDVAERKVHPQKFVFDAIYSRSIAEISDAVISLDTSAYGAVVVDSISHIWDAAIDAYCGRRTRADSIPMQAWARIKRPYKRLLSCMMDLDAHAFFLGRQKILYEDDPESGGIRRVGLAMRAEVETAYEPHICCRMEARQTQSGVTEHLCYVEKDRTGVLSGRTLIDPGPTSLDMLLPLLGSRQARSDDEEGRIDADADMLAADDERVRSREEKSASLFSDAHAAIVVCRDLPSLDAAATAIKKIRRSLTDEHQSALRQIYNSRRDELVRSTTRDI